MNSKFEIAEQPGLYKVTGLVTEAEIMAMSQQIFFEKLKSAFVVSKPSDAFVYLAEVFKNERVEKLSTLWLDSQHKVISLDVLSQGTLNAASVYPREVVVAALKNDAQAVILVHNHSSSVVEPSRTDKVITTKLVSALKTVDIKVLDHVIVGAGGQYSFAENLLL